MKKINKKHFKKLAKKEAKFKNRNKDKFQGCDHYRSDEGFRHERFNLERLLKWIYRVTVAL